MLATYSLYRDFYSPRELSRLAAAPGPDTALSEINLLRIMLRRIMASVARKARQLSLEKHLSMLAAIGYSGEMIASLVRFDHHYLSSNIFVDPLLASIAAHDLEDL